MSIWRVDKSHMVAVPETYTVDGLDDLRRQVQATANSKRNRPIIGSLEFEHLVRSGEEVVLAFFYSHAPSNAGKKVRFMRLIRND